MSISPKKCPCHSGLNYSDCCKPFHTRAQIASPVQLMRSRYAAYALSLPNYIIETTAKEGPQYQKDPIAWRKGIFEFSRSTLFENLYILEDHMQGDEAFVTFQAILKQGSLDKSYVEKSRFVRLNGQWLYHSGSVQ